MSKNVVLSGYYGFNNAGDEAVLYSIINSLRKLDGNIEITVLSNKPADTAKSYGVKAVNRWKLADVTQAIRASDLLISGGGSLLQDVTSKNGILYYLGIMGIARILRKPVFIYSQGIGPVSHSRNRWLVGKMLNRAQGITVRDHQSKAELINMGVKKEIVVSSDPVLSFAPEEIEISKGQELLCRGAVNIEGKILAVSLRSWKTDGANFKAIARACDQLACQDWQIVFVPMHFPEDIAIAREVAKEMKREAIVLKENYSPAEALAIYKSSDMVLGMRLHALIMAAVVEKPLVAISYDPKIDNFMELLDIQEPLQINNLNTQEILDSIGNTWENRDVFVKNLQKKTAPLRKQAMVPGEMIADLLAKG